MPGVTHERTKVMYHRKRDKAGVGGRVARETRVSGEMASRSMRSVNVGRSGTHRANEPGEKANGRPGGMRAARDRNEEKKRRSASEDEPKE